MNRPLLRRRTGLDVAPKRRHHPSREGQHERIIPSQIERGAGQVQAPGGLLLRRTRPSGEHADEIEPGRQRASAGVIRVERQCHLKQSDAFVGARSRRPVMLEKRSQVIVIGI